MRAINVKERYRGEPNGVTDTDILGTNCSPALRGRAIIDRPYRRNETEGSPMVPRIRKPYAGIDTAGTAGRDGEPVPYRVCRGAGQERYRGEPNGVTNTDILGTNCSPALRGWRKWERRFGKIHNCNWTGNKIQYIVQNDTYFPPLVVWLAGFGRAITDRPYERNDTERALRM